MIDLVALTNSIRSHEGYSSEPYKDSLGFWTVGWGTNIDSYVTNKANHETWLNRDIDIAIVAAAKWLGDVWATTSEPRQNVIAEMMYQLGQSHMSLFEKLRAALLRHDYAEAALQMRLSRWYDQVPQRASELIAIMEHG